MRLSELRGAADPRCVDSEEKLGENAVEWRERLLERCAAGFDILLGALEIRAHNGRLNRDLDLSVRDPPFSAAARRCGIRDDESCRPRKRCSRRIPKSPRSTRSLMRPVA